MASAIRTSARVSHLSLSSSIQCLNAEREYVAVESSATTRTSWLFAGAKSDEAKRSKDAKRIRNRSFTFSPY
jgi:hypothetical protein